MTSAYLLYVLVALCSVESGHKTNAINFQDGGSPSYGECQIKAKTARFLGYTGPISELWLNKETNRKWALEYLKYQYSRYHGDLKKTVSAYNCGSACNNKQYVSKVLRRASYVAVGGY